MQPTLKKRRDSRHWWRRMMSRKHRKTIIKKVICVWFLSIATYLITALQLIPNDLLGVIWAILVVAIIIPGKSEGEKGAEMIISSEEKHWLSGADNKLESDIWEKLVIKSVRENLKAQRNTEKVR